MHSDCVFFIRLCQSQHVTLKVINSLDFRSSIQGETVSCFPFKIFWMFPSGGVEPSWPFCGQDLWSRREVHVPCIRDFLISYTFFPEVSRPVKIFKTFGPRPFTFTSNSRILFIFPLLCLFFATVQLSFPVDVCLSDPSKCFTRPRARNTKNKTLRNFRRRDAQRR